LKRRLRGGLNSSIIPVKNVPKRQAGGAWSGKAVRFSGKAKLVTTAMPREAQKRETGAKQNC
jgi:hypothetical protein